MIGGEAIVSIVLNLPTTGPVLLNALMWQDMFLAAGFLMLLSLMTIIGMLLSDLLLAWLDPRIRYDKLGEETLMANEVIDAPELVPPCRRSRPSTKRLPRIVVASQWKLMWWKFRKHRLAMVSLTLSSSPCISSPFRRVSSRRRPPHSYHRTYTQAPPQTIHWFDNGAFAPFVYGYKQTTDPQTYKRTYVIDENNENSARLFRAWRSAIRSGLHGIPIPGISSAAFQLEYSPVRPDQAGRSVLSCSARTTWDATFSAA